MTEKIIVISNGGTIKAGLSGDSTPSCIFPTIYGRPFCSRTPDQLQNPQNYIFVGEQALAKISTGTRIFYPIEKKILRDTSIDMMTKIWEVTFNKLNVSPKNHPVLITESLLYSEKIREYILSTMFETFEVPAIYIANENVLSLYASGLKTGTVVDVGKESCHIVPIYEGHPIRHSFGVVDLGGDNITEYLTKLCNDRGLEVNNRPQREKMKEMKEKLCYIALDYKAELENASQLNLEKTFQIEDDLVFTIQNERFMSPEILFNPSLIEKQDPGVDVATVESIVKCDNSLRDDLFKNIILSGSTTFFPGFTERIQKGICSHSNNVAKVYAPPERGYSTWLGGSMLGSLENFSQMCVQKKDYEEDGPTILNKMFN